MLILLRFRSSDPTLLCKINLTIQCEVVIISFDNNINYKVVRNESWVSAIEFSIIQKYFFWASVLYARHCGRAKQSKYCFFDSRLADIAWFQTQTWNGFDEVNFYWKLFQAALFLYITPAMIVWNTKQKLLTVRVC